MDYKKIEKNVKQLEKLTADYSKLERNVKLANESMTNMVMDLSKNEVKPDSEDGKKFINFTNIIRGIGHRLLNLLEINITCSFAGATLFTWSLPKIKENQVVDINSSKTNENL